MPGLLLLTSSILYKAMTILLPIFQKIPFEWAIDKILTIEAFSTFNSA